MLTLEEKRETIEQIPSEKLLRLYDRYSDNFEPSDYEMCETYEIIKAEILARMKSGNGGY